MEVKLSAVSATTQSIKMSRKSMLKRNKTKVNTAFSEILLACFVWCVSDQYTPLVISCPDIELLLHAVPHHLYRTVRPEL